MTQYCWIQSVGYTESPNDHLFFVKYYHVYVDKLANQSFK